MVFWLLYILRFQRVCVLMVYCVLKIMHLNYNEKSTYFNEKSAYNEKIQLNSLADDCDADLILRVCST